MSAPSIEQEPLLQNQNRRGKPAIVTRAIASSAVFFLFGLILVFVLETSPAFWRLGDHLPDDPLAAAKEILKAAPVIVSD
jgi:hypothetical protein